MLRLTVQAQTLWHSMKEGFIDRMRREDGTVSVEYAGIVVVVAAIIVAILAQATPIGNKLAQGINKQIDKFLK
jgi:Flp pilus assembly pilin Flp